MLRRLALLVGAVGVAVALVLVGVGVHFWSAGRDDVVRSGDVVALRLGEDPPPWWPITRSSRTRVRVGVGVEGTLVALDGGCVGLRQSPAVDGDGPDVVEVVLVLPHDTRITRAGGRVVLHSAGRTARLGDRVQGGSSFADRSDLAARDVPAACRRTPRIDFVLEGD